jgi:ABC-2 type transport system permease protein
MGRYVNIFAKSLRDQRWQIGGFGLALLSMAAMIVLLWPTYRNTVANIQLPEAVQALLGSDLSYATAAGFVSAEFFSWIPILLIVYAVIQGTGAIAGEESSGTIDLLMAQPLARSAMVFQKCAAVLAGSVLIVSLGYLGFALTIPFVTIEISIGDAAIASANMLPITILYFAFALWLGAVAPNRAYASGGAIALGTAGYFANTIAAGVNALSWLRYASPFYYYGAGLPLVKGIDWPHVSILLGVAALFIALTVRSFQRRDITIGGASNVGFRALMRRAVG